MNIHINPKLSLVPLSPKHTDALYQTIKTNADHLKQWLGWIERTAKLADTVAFIYQTQQAEVKGRSQHFAIEVDHAFSGVISLEAIEQLSRQAQIGYWLAAEKTGKGTMTLAVNALLAHAFNELKLHKIEIRCAEKNRASRAIPERLGFRQDGFLRDNEWLYDRFVNHVVYSLLATEFKSH